MNNFFYSIKLKNYDLPFSRSIAVSIFAHGILITIIFLLVNSLHPNKPLHLPQTITLISLPMVEERIKIPNSTPQRAQTASVKKTSPLPVAMPPLEPVTTASPSATETNPVPFATTAQEETKSQPGQPGGVTGGTQQTTGDKEGAIRIGSAQTLDNVDFSPLYNPKPAYPLIALKAGIQGSVDVDLIINEFGRVEEFSIVNVTGHPLFGEETAKVIGKWRFPTPRVEGKKVKIKFLYTVNFKLD